MSVLAVTVTIAVYSTLTIETETRNRLLYISAASYADLR
jgi:hypothetical protein